MPIFDISWGSAQRTRRPRLVGQGCCGIPGLDTWRQFPDMVFPMRSPSDTWWREHICCEGIGRSLSSSTSGCSSDWEVYWFLFGDHDFTVL